MAQALALSLPWANLDVHLDAVVSGSGLMLLMELAATPLDPSLAAWAVVAGSGCFLACAWLAALAGVSCVAPVWLCLISSSVNLLLALAVALNVFARLCPHEGKELVLIPVYFLLCMSRLQPYLLWPLALFGLLCMIMLLWPGRDQGLAEGALWYSGNYAYGDSVSDPVAFVALALFSAYDPLSQLCRLSETMVHFPLDPSWRLAAEPGGFGGKGSWLRDASLGALARCLVFVVLALARPTWSDTLLSLFLAPLPTYSAPYVFSYLSSAFAFVLLLSCMGMACDWFLALRWVLERVSRRGFPAGRLVRLQHILNALVVGASWAFPLENAPLSLALRAIAAGVVVGGALIGCCV